MRTRNRASEREMSATALCCKSASTPTVAPAAASNRIVRINDDAE
jgi:hypothetical protein